MIFTISFPASCAVPEKGLIVTAVLPGEGGRSPAIGVPAHSKSCISPVLRCVSPQMQEERIILSYPAKAQAYFYDTCKSRRHQYRRSDISLPTKRC